MVRGRRLRSAYNAVSAQADDDDNHEATEVLVDEDNTTPTTNNGDDIDNNNDVEAPPQQRRLVGGRTQRQYQTVSNTDTDADTTKAAKEQDDDEDGDDDDKTVTEDDEEDDFDDEEQGGTKVTLVILDPAQKKFHIPAWSRWTVATFKRKSERIHKVAPSSQRLIYRGQLLQDHMTLEQVGLNQDHLILHLFPKPRVVIQRSHEASSAPSSQGSCSAAGGDSTAGDGDDDETAGAHVPQIVLNPDEAEQRATILVLGSADFLEAQNNVKLFSFLLLVISSIELFNLILILMGVPPDPSGGSNAYTNTEDDIFHIDTNATTYEDAAYNSYGNSNNNNNNLQMVDPYEQAQINEEMQTWHPRNNVDLFISALGVYVALLGIRATNETTLRVAKQYLVGTVVVGIAWMMYNYWFTVHVDEEFDQLRRDERHNHTQAPWGGNGTDPRHPSYGPSDTHYDDDAIPYKSEWDYYQQNLSLMLIPGMVWILCCVRAWQFQSLLEEAEHEAEERIRNELEQHRVVVTEAVNGNNNDNDEANNDPGNDNDDDDVDGAPPRRVRGSRNRRGRESNRRRDDDVLEVDLELQNSSAVIT